VDEGHETIVVMISSNKSEFYGDGLIEVVERSCSML